MIFLNFKIYRQTCGENTLKLCRLIRQLADKLVIPCLQAVDIYQVKQALPDLEIWAQHADPVESGKFTGWQAPASLKFAGASGVLLNHAEHLLDWSTIIKTTAFCRKVGLKFMLMASDLAMITKFNTLKPDFIAFEDPRLIGGPVAMIDAHEALIKKAVQVAQAPLIIGGGIRNKLHVQKALAAGGAGVLVASEFAKSDNQEQTLKELILGLDR
ncbi:MAG: triose-phosphate isomerase [Candidatus Beckwithbacteria bacterium]|nr:triose-phosphate isomerase [Candidatus Beckwithbacteria bacterium]